MNWAKLSLTSVIFRLIAAFCPVWNCTSMVYDVCVAISQNQLLVNSNGCDRDFYCSYADVMKWYSPKALPSRDQFNCTRQDFTPNTTIGSDTVFCGNRNYNDELLSGSHPKRCLSVSDCRTLGGWTTDCLCGMDGYMYCQPEMGSGAMEEYWTLCEEHQNRTNDPRVTEAVKAYWLGYQEYYTLVRSAPDCVWRILNEFLVLSALKEAAESSAPLLLLSPLLLVTA